MKPRILVGDDELSLREVFKSYLAMVGFDVDLVETPDELIEKARIAHDTDTRYALIASDFNYNANIDGIEAISRIRKFDKETLILLHSAVIFGENDELAVRAREAGSNYALPKMGLDSFKVVLEKISKSK